LSQKEFHGPEAAFKKIGNALRGLRRKLERLHLVLFPGTRLLQLPRVASPVSQFGLTRTRDLCRDSTEAGSNLLKLSVTDGIYWRSEIPLITVIGPLSDPRPLPYRPLPDNDSASSDALLNFYAKLSPTISSLFFQRAFAFSGSSA
jgi:hypothetical protein